MANAGDEHAFDPERQALAKRYQRQALLLGLSGLLLFLGVAYLSLISGISVRLEGWARSWSDNPWVVIALYVIVGYLGLAVLALPLRTAGRGSEVRYGMSRQSWPSWAFDRAKATFFGLLLALVGAQALYWTIRNFGEVWWVVFWFLLLGFGLLAGFLGPVVLLPMFYKVRKPRDEDVTARLQALSRRAGVRTLGVFEFRSGAKSERGNAALAGIGRTRRVLLSDHILKNYSPREVEGILAHELAHHIHRDASLLLLLAAVSSVLALLLVAVVVPATMGAFGIERLDQVANLPLFLLVGTLFTLATGPLRRAVTRVREAAADATGARLSGDPEALASALVKLHDQNLADAHPKPWVERLFYTHPSGGRRVQALLRLAKSEN